MTLQGLDADLGHLQAELAGQTASTRRPNSTAEQARARLEDEVIRPRERSSLRGHFLAQLWRNAWP